MIVKGLKNSATQSVRFSQAPKPYVCIEQQLQAFNASISFSSITGEIMSPSISISPAIEPIHSVRSFMGEGATTSATGFPKRVIRTGFRVLRTRSKIDRHLALNSEIEISSMTTLLYHGQNI